jgi:hypothetical protein
VRIIEGAQNPMFPLAQDTGRKRAALGADTSSLRRSIVFAPLLAGLPFVFHGSSANASRINPSETRVTLPDNIDWSGWLSGFPAQSAEMAKLYGDPNESGPYLVLMKWYPGFMSAPHSYATDRICAVVSGTWWVNSGADFDPANTVPVPAEGFVLRAARTPHYDGVRADAKEPVTIAIFGMAPINLELVEQGKPAWRKV